MITIFDLRTSECILCGDECGRPLCARCDERVRDASLERWQLIDERFRCRSCEEHYVWAPALDRGYYYCLSCATEKWCERCGMTLSRLVFVWELNALCDQCAHIQQVVEWKERVKERLHDAAAKHGFELRDACLAQTGTEYLTYRCLECGCELTVRLSDHMSAYGSEDVSIDYGGLDGKIDDAVELFRSHVCAEEEE